ncbi:conserved unknown protein [Ectocarpus siliculosus]|uniref:Importin subunit alpha n=1 Tax=Ectocarpus siliculosus TaxID=2880 RepID=D7FUH9_ECTSI|nr:conserved unknown protein [Ectocarpus siliculosus]|eukprot:CBJ31635.1 conserved unknown protein [Ectocarpus siliculosus]
MSSQTSSSSMQKRRDIKAGVDPTDLRRRRADTALSLRKQKKESGLEDAAQKPVSAADVPDLTRALAAGAGGPAARVEAARGLRKVLSLETDPPVAEVIQAGAMPLLVLCLDEHSSTDLQFEAAWALTNIASTCKTDAVVQHGAVPALVRNLRHHNQDLREQCAWCLGNIAGDCAELRDVVLGTPDALEGLLLNVVQPATPSLLRNCVWALSNMCRGKPQPDMSLLAPALPVLLNLLSSDDSEVLVDTCWALSYLSDGTTERIETVISSGVARPLTALLQHGDSNVVTPALRTLGNFVTGSDVQTQAVLDLGVLPHLQSLLRHPKKNIRKEACWTLSNIVAGTSPQMASVCDSPGLLGGVIELLSGDVWEVQKEANFVISNVATASDASRVRQLVNLEAIPALSSMLDRADAKAILVALDAISAIFALDSEDNGLPWVQMFDESGGLDRLEQLQEHENRAVYDKAIEIIERFYGCEDDDEEDAHVAPTVVDGASTFSFGAADAATPGKTASSTCGAEMNSSPCGGGAGMPIFGSPVRALNFA